MEQNPDKESMDNNKTEHGNHKDTQKMDTSKTNEAQQPKHIVGRSTPAPSTGDTPAVSEGSHITTPDPPSGGRSTRSTPHHLGAMARNMVTAYKPGTDLRLCDPSFFDARYAMTGIPDGYSVEGSVIKRHKADLKIPVCRLFKVIGILSDRYAESYSYLFRWYDRDQRPHTRSVPFSEFRNNSSDCLRTLANGGISFNPYNARSVIDYILDSEGCALSIALVQQPGWNGTSFAMPYHDQLVICPHSERAHYYDCNIDIKHRPALIGSLDNWRESIARMAKGNPHLAFSISAAFAGPLLELSNTQSFILHMYGDSSKGKTTIIKAACTVTGTDVAQWRTTDNGLEALLSRYNDAMIPLDEIAQSDALHLGSIVYMLANGSGKTRMNAQAEIRRSYTWRLIALSNGETSISTRIKQGSGYTNTGQAVRAIDIPYTETETTPLWPNLHGHASTKDLVEAIIKASAQERGHAFRAYIPWVVANRDSLTTDIQAFQKAFHAMCGGDSSGPVLRVADRFALIAFAGEFASAIGITGWEQGEATAAALYLFTQWHDQCQLSSRDNGSRFIDMLREFIRLNISLFYDISGHTNKNNVPQTSIKWLGYRRRESPSSVFEYLIPIAIWDAQVFPGQDSKLANRVLAERGIIKPKRDADGKIIRYNQSIYIPSQGNLRLYVIGADLFEGDVDGDGSITEHVTGPINPPSES